MKTSKKLFLEFLNDDIWWGCNGYYTNGDIKFDDDSQTVELIGGIINAGFNQDGFETLETFFEKWLEAKNDKG